MPQASDKSSSNGTQFPCYSFERLGPDLLGCKASSVISGRLLLGYRPLAAWHPFVLLETSASASQIDLYRILTTCSSSCASQLTYLSPNVVVIQNSAFCMHQVLNRLYVSLSSTEDLDAFNINPTSPLANRIRYPVSVCNKRYSRPHDSCCTNRTRFVRANQGSNQIGSFPIWKKQLELPSFSVRSWIFVCFFSVMRLRNNFAVF